MGIFTNLGALLRTGDTTYNGSTYSKPMQEVLDVSQSNENYLANWMRSISGSGLTDAQRQANAFTASREDLAWMRQMDASNTQYQRAVADMQAAGINPLMAVSNGGASVPSASSSGSVSPNTSPLNLGSLLSAISSLSLVGPQKEALEADVALKGSQANLNNANAAKLKEDTRGSKLQNDFFENSQDLRLQALKNENDVSEATAHQIWSKIDEQKANISKLIKEAATEEERASLLASERVLNEVTAKKVEFMMQYEANLMAAQTDAQKARAGLDYLLAAREKGLLDGGQVQSILREAEAAADSAEAKAAIEKVRERAAHGDFRPLQEVHDDMNLGEKVVNAIYGGIHSVRTALSPLK